MLYYIIFMEETPFTALKVLKDKGPVNDPCASVSYIR
jgi:hypothetical protein